MYSCGKKFPDPLNTYAQENEGELEKKKISRKSSSTCPIKKKLYPCPGSNPF